MKANLKLAVFIVKTGRFFLHGTRQTLDMTNPGHIRRYLKRQY
jgi:hypothetical protein